MSNTLPKEQQTAFQRWELHSFDEPQPSRKPATAAGAAAGGIEEAARQRDEARARGHAEGFAEGRASGFEQGREAGHAEGLAQGRAAVAAEAQRLQNVARQLGEQAAQADEAIAADVLGLALDIAKAMLKTALPARAELVLPVVSEAIRYLPSLQQPALLMINPDDAAVIRSHLHDELDKAGWRVVEDEQVQRGGCRIDTASNQIDATVEIRWQRIAEALGRQSDWLRE